MFYPDRATALSELAADKAARLDDLKAKLAAREARPGFKRNAQLIRAEIARLEQQEASRGQA